MKWTLDLSAGFIVGPVHFQVYVRGGSEILTGSVDRWIIRKSAYVFVHLVRPNRPRRLVQTLEDMLQIKFRIETDHVLRERVGLNQKEPPHVFCGKLLVCYPIHCDGGGNVHKANFIDPLGVIETQPVRD